MATNTRYTILWPANSICIFLSLRFQFLDTNVLQFSARSALPQFVGRRVLVKPWFHWKLLTEIQISIAELKICGPRETWVVRIHVIQFQSNENNNRTRGERQFYDPIIATKKSSRFFFSQFNVRLMCGAQIVPNTSCSCIFSRYWHKLQAHSHTLAHINRSCYSFAVKLIPHGAYTVFHWLVPLHSNIRGFVVSFHCSQSMKRHISTARLSKLHESINLN